MLYHSTRNNALTANSTEAVIRGIADDGGLYMLPDFSAIRFDWRRLLSLSAKEMSAAVLHALLDDFSVEEVKGMVSRAYDGRFDTEELTPTKRVGDRFVCELWHGPTAAFKDVALSVLPQLLVGARRKIGSKKETLILTATSGDTGKAALAGFADVEGIKIMVFYPKDGVSAVQQAQMVTQEGNNVCVCAVQGNFDDAQTAVKNTFAAYREQPLETVELSSANSINIGRLAPQIMYYFKAYADLCKSGDITEGETVNFAVPTGNFGNILAGYLARCMGLPIGRLICASNANNVLTDFLKTGCYDKRRTFYQTVSPSMDILVSSNLERLLYLLSDGDAPLVADYMKQLNETGCYTVNDSLLHRIQSVFSAGFCDDAQTMETIRRVYETDGYLCDTHTAVALSVTDRLALGGKTVVLSTASPYKFPVAVLKALGELVQGDDFAAMERLHEKTGVPVPKGLCNLQNKPVLHHDCIRKEDLTDYVFEKARKQTWIE